MKLNKIICSIRQRTVNWTDVNVNYSNRNRELNTEHTEENVRDQWDTMKNLRCA